MEETKNLIQKLAEIRKMSDAVKKDRSGHTYTYTDINTIQEDLYSGRGSCHGRHHRRF